MQAEGCGCESRRVHSGHAHVRARGLGSGAGHRWASKTRRARFDSSTARSWFFAFRSLLSCACRCACWTVRWPASSDTRGGRGSTPLGTTARSRLRFSPAVPRGERRPSSVAVVFREDVRLSIGGVGFDSPPRRVAFVFWEDRRFSIGSGEFDSRTRRRPAARASGTPAPQVVHRPLTPAPRGSTPRRPIGVRIAAGPSALTRETVVRIHASELRVRPCEVAKWKGTRLLSGSRAGSIPALAAPPLQHEGRAPSPYLGGVGSIPTGGLLDLDPQA